MAEVTVAFKVCSDAINTAETGLRDVQQNDLADMLRVLQSNEQEKLRLTLILQALRQAYARGFSWQLQVPVGAQALPGTDISSYSFTKATHACFDNKCLGTVHNALTPWMQLQL